MEDLQRDKESNTTEGMHAMGMWILQDFMNEAMADLYTEKLHCNAKEIESTKKSTRDAVVDRAKNEKFCLEHRHMRPNGTLMKDLDRKSATC